MAMCRFRTIGPHRHKCRACGFEVQSRFAPHKIHRWCPPDPTPLLTRLAELTGHPEIIDQPKRYGRAVQQWAAGIPGSIEPFEIRDDSEAEVCESLCQENACGKHQGGVCKPSCGPGMIVAVKARMATEGCPHRLRRW